MRYHKGSDPWGRGSYPIPQYAVIGASDTGTWADSPANSHVAATELEDFRKVLRTHGIRSRISYTQSGNIFMVKLWVVVNSRDFARGERLAKAYLKRMHDRTRLIHEAA